MRAKNVFDDVNISEMIDRVVAMKTVQELSKSELSTQFWSCLKLWQDTRKFIIPLFGESSRSFRDLCNPDYDLNISWDDRPNSSKSGISTLGVNDMMV